MVERKNIRPTLTRFTDEDFRNKRSERDIQHDLREFIEHMPWYMLKKLREAHGAGQSQIAAEIGVSVPQYSKYENGHLLPKLEVALGIAAFFGKKGLTDLQVALHDELEKVQKEAKNIHFEVKPGSVKLHGRAAATVVNRANIVHYNTVETARVFPQEASVQITQQDNATIPTPPALADVENAYALTAPNHHMHPRYSEGDVVYVNPNIKPSEGDDVAILLTFKDRKVAILREIWKSKFEPIGPEAYYDHYEFVSWAQRDWSKMEAGFKFDSLKDFPKLIEESLKILTKSIFTLTLFSDGNVLVAGEETDHEQILHVQVHVIVGCERKRESKTAVGGYGTGAFGEGPFGG